MIPGVAITALLLLTGCSAVPPAAIPVSGAVHCSYRGELPDPHCTPGFANPNVTQADIYSTICKKGWTRTVRQPESVTEQYKYNVAYPAYGIPDGTRTILDDLDPLELGGLSAPPNWWPEQPQASYAKDRVENALNHAVCSGTVTLKAAQKAIVANWTTAEQKLGIGG